MKNVASPAGWEGSSPPGHIPYDDSMMERFDMPRIYKKTKLIYGIVVWAELFESDQALP